jgi:hypothetical protein
VERQAGIGEVVDMVEKTTRRVNKKKGNDRIKR